MWEQRVYRWEEDVPKGVYQRTDIYMKHLRNLWREERDTSYKDYIIVSDEENFLIAIWNGKNKEVWVYQRLST